MDPTMSVNRIVARNRSGSRAFDAKNRLSPAQFSVTQGSFPIVQLSCPAGTSKTSPGRNSRVLPSLQNHAPSSRHSETDMVRLAPLTTDDGFRVLGPTPPGRDDLATDHEPADLDDFLEEAGKLDDLVRLVEVLGRQLHAPSSTAFASWVNSGCKRLGAPRSRGRCLAIIGRRRCRATQDGFVRRVQSSARLSLDLADRTNHGLRGITALADQSGECHH